MEDSEIDYYNSRSVYRFKNIGDDYYHHGEKQLAKEYYLRAKRILDCLEDQNYVIDYLQDNHLGEILRDEGSYQAAKEYYLWVIEQLGRVKNSRDDQLKAWLEIFNVEKQSGNIEEMKNVCRKVNQMIIERCFGQDGPFDLVSLAFYHDEMHEIKLIIDILKCYSECVEKNSEEYLNSLIRLGTFLIYKDNQNYMIYYDLAIEWVKKHQNEIEFEKLLKEVCNQYFSADRAKHIEYYYPKLLETVEGRYEKHDLELVRVYEIYARNLIHYVKNNIHLLEKGVEVYQYALSLYEYHYPLGSKELNQCYVDALETYFTNNLNELFDQLAVSFTDRLIVQFGNESQEVKQFTKEVLRYQEISKSGKWFISELRITL